MRCLSGFSTSIKCVCQFRFRIDHNDIAERQLVMKGCEEKSWFNLVKTILETYNLPSIFSLFNQQIPQSKWKSMLNKAVNEYIEAKWQNDLKAKSSLKYINPNSLKVGKLVLPVNVCSDFQNPEFLTQLTLDCSVYVDRFEDIEFLELCSREFIDQIHKRRITRLNEISQR